MGGHAFDTDGLSTPRMPTEIYLQVRERILRILRNHFQHAHSPIEAPAKEHHGDVDVLVAKPVGSNAIRDPAWLVGLVGAKHWKRMKGSDTIHLAIPWPTSADSESPSRGAVHGTLTSISTHPEPDPNDPDKYIQLDISLLPNLTTLSWLLFLHAHGDFWSILGSLLRRYGLTCTPSGFYLHIPEIEGQNKSLSRVKVTDDPGLVLRYLDLEEERYWTGFGTWDEMLGYACECRLVDLGRGKRREEHERREREEKEKEGLLIEQGDAAIDGESAVAEVDPNEPSGSLAVNGTTSTAMIDTKNGVPRTAPSPTTPALPARTQDLANLENGGPPLNSDDRQKARKRPLFSYFITTYIDAHATVDTPPGSAAKLTKQEVVEDAKVFFGEEFTKRYGKARRKGIEVVGVQALWSNVRNTIKEERGEGDELGYGMKGVKACVCGDEFGFLDRDDCGQKEWEGDVDGIGYRGIRCARDAFGEMRYDEVLEWAKVNWRKVGERQKKIDMEISGKKLAAKMEAERMKAMVHEGRKSP